MIIKISNSDIENCILTNENLFSAMIPIDNVVLVVYQKNNKPDGSFPFKEITQEEFDKLKPVSEYVDKQTPSEPTDTELLMQAISDLELRILQEQQDRQLLAQQISDLEIAMMGGAKQ